MNKFTELAPHARGYITADDCDINDFKALTSQSTDPADVPLAHDISHNVPLYDMAALADALEDRNARRALMTEWAGVLRFGPGALVLQGAVTDLDAIDAATEVYTRIIAEERAASGDKADHFAAKGSNDRIWNALEKLCLRAPEVFMRYFASPAIDAVCEAWLGPNYQMTAQINLVHPGGAAQTAHRDYHLGFQTEDVSAQYPAHVHELSSVLTLQGAIAHCDMPVASGPTKLLPFSQAYLPGYMAWRRPEFRAHFEAACIQLPLTKGDAVFFNPALFHAAGANSSLDIHRMANLLQVSSAMGRAMEAVRRADMCLALYPVARAMGARGVGSGYHAAIAAAAEGYSFPTNLDTDPPVGGLAPETQRALMLRALKENWTFDLFERELRAQARRRSGP